MALYHRRGHPLLFVSIPARNALIGYCPALLVSQMTVVSTAQRIVSCISWLCTDVAVPVEGVIGSPALYVSLTAMLCVTGGFLSLLIPSP